MKNMEAQRTAKNLSDSITRAKLLRLSTVEEAARSVGLDPIQLSSMVAGAERAHTLRGKHISLDAAEELALGAALLSPAAQGARG